jgi:DNA uptake protein ComE-like DNA-binding protein
MNFKQLREIFIFTRKERNGLLLLLLILLFVICLNVLLPHFLPGKEYDTTAWSLEAEKYYAQAAPRSEPDSFNNKLVLDPNLAELKVLVEIGIPSPLAANWIKYLQKGGHFRKKEEVMKLYGMTPDLYRKIQGHLEIPKQGLRIKLKTDSIKSGKMRFAGAFAKDSSWRRGKKEQKEIQLVEINSADSVQLESLPGIGPVLASRIIKYRRLLGGFYAVVQLKEIFGMSEELWTKSSPWLRVDPSEIKKVAINFQSLSELGRHPYIGFRQAKKIVKKRDTTGKFNKNEELIAFFSPDSLQHLLPYLSISGSEP